MNADVPEKGAEPNPAAGAAGRYVIGIDLGTTNSAVSFVDTTEEPWQVRNFPVPQVVAPGQVEARDTLPSFHYQPAPGEFPSGAIRLPWSTQDPEETVGFFARDHGTLVPGRLVASAKSWLCHPGVDRTAELLPWHGAADVTRLSPVEVSSRYLQQIREAWDAGHPNFPMAVQDVVLTLPASFDEVARELTVKAAALAGLNRVVLIEEPQAAFYAWIYAHPDDWERKVEPGQKILVCDVGGGTSDFTLIRVRAAEGGEDETAKRIQFHRVAVGEHLILGGDNLDLALASFLEPRLAGGKKLEPRQWGVLVRTCRRVKETLLGDNPPEQLTVNVPGSGTRLIGGGLQTSATRDEVQHLLRDGFLPFVGLEEKPTKRSSGFQEFGLPYAPDPAITRYLATFLTAHRLVALDRPEISASPADAADPAHNDPARPDIVLFNGGLFASVVLRDRLLDVLRSWFRSAKNPNWEPLVLRNDRLDLAVARGAAYYGMVRRGKGVRIAAGLARTYFIGVEGANNSYQALCLVPAGVEPLHDVELNERQFNLLLSQPIEFPLYVSSARLTDQPGDLIDVDPEQISSLPPIRTVLRSSKQTESGTVAVNLRARLTEIGTLDLWCSEVAGKRSWRLQFDVRSATRTDLQAHESAAEQEGFLDEAAWEECLAVLHNTFGPTGKENPEGLAKSVARVLGMPRHEWPSSLLRRIWETLMEVEPGRRRSPVHEARWLNLLGFSLRPGYGLALDDWRVAETWRVLQGKLAHAAAICRVEWWILWRRIAGGLESGQQSALAAPLLVPLRGMHRQLTTGKGRGDFSIESKDSAEIWRLLGSLELLPIRTKVELGNILLDLLPRKKFEGVKPAIEWAVGRMGARIPVYGPLNAVVPVEVISDWLRKLMQLDDSHPQSLLAILQMARRTEDRYRDIPDALRDDVLGWFTFYKAPPHFGELVRTGGLLDSEEQGLVFGESLPKGLRIL